LSADQGFAQAQLNYGFLLYHGDGILMNKSLAAHYFQLSADQGDAQAQFNYGFLLYHGDGILMNKSLAAHYYKLSADQGDAQAQLNYGFLLYHGDGILMNKSLAAHYYKLSADQGSIQGQIEYAEWILHGDGVHAIVARRESESYFRMGVAQGDWRAQMRLGIGLLSGLFGRFDFIEARKLFEFASRSEHSLTQFAILLRDSLSLSDGDITNATDYLSTGNIFSILRSSFDESIPLIRILNSDLYNWDESENAIFEAWQDIARFSIEYLLDLSQSESIQTSPDVQSDDLNQRPVLNSLPTDLLSCNSILEIIPVIFKMYSIESSLYKNVNHFLHCFPIRIIDKFMKEVGGILRYIYLLQSSIEYCSHMKPLISNMIVYRGIEQQGKHLVPLYESMIGEVIVWPGFTSTSADRDFVISRFIKGPDSLLFEIKLHPGDIAVKIHEYSAYQEESEILIAASSGFKVKSVDWIDISGMKIAQIRLSYFISWYNFNIDDPPAPILV
jgi:TPR repeat protein